MRECRLGSFLMALDVIDRLLDGRDLFGVVVRYLDFELFFQSHDDLHHVQRVGVEIVYDARLKCHFIFADVELLDENLLAGDSEYLAVGVALSLHDTEVILWVLQNRQRLKRPVPYKHPNGVVRWVPLSPATETAVMKQLGPGR